MKISDMYTNHDITRGVGGRSRMYKIVQRFREISPMYFNHEVHGPFPGYTKKMSAFWIAWIMLITANAKTDVKEEIEIAIREGAENGKAFIDWFISEARFDFNMIESIEISRGLPLHIRVTQTDSKYFDLTRSSQTCGVRSLFTKHVLRNIAQSLAKADVETDLI